MNGEHKARATLILTKTENFICLLPFLDALIMTNEERNINQSSELVDLIARKTLFIC